ncbi:hypothetical protein AC578_2121 [Pseudocercospora eumusae]|uniref:Uncharacterized protein n=1 Tax=Pseudocercospora eumusae TaxID=321146 RepID=A0A139HQJ9_9PEZI|nr:hypothetical protein AC578_2121 [Pseudocercospora eumusae]
MDARKDEPELLWTTPTPGQTSMDKYRRHVNTRFYQNLRTSHDLHRWSVERPHDFWRDLYSYLELKPRLPPGKKAYDDTIPISKNPKWFHGLEMNYAENALFSNPDDSAIALIGLRDDSETSSMLTWRQFRDQVRIAASALRNCGIQKGDRVAALVATSIPAQVLYHASASIAAIFTCISPDLGLEGCVSRLKQVRPTIIFADSHTIYKGKAVSTISKVESIVKRLELQPQLFIVPLKPLPTTLPIFDDFLRKAKPHDELTFTRVPFNYPLMICYSSGTTGDPKCIVHQHGLILQLKKIAVVHNNTTPKDVIMQYSSTSWVVFYVMNGYFASGATTIVYNGSPIYPNAKQLLRICEKYGVTYFGTSPRYLLELEMSKTIPKKEFDLKSLRIVYTTGATLSAEQYRWFYRSFPSRVHLCNTAGGTDTATSLIAADPAGPVYAGEMQIFALGMDVDVAHPETGQSILESGDAGEMIVRRPFPSMPCFFWGDEGGAKYRESYFSRFDNIDVWAQHDWLQYNAKTGGLIMHGRSDGVLNPSGIRFGSGEIYSIVEAPPFTEEISQTLCVGRRRPQDKDEDVFLFCVMLEGHKMTPELVNAIRSAIKSSLSARHVPRFIIPVPEVPTTINGKKVESAIKQTISGKDVNPSNTVSNPHAIAYFKRFREIDREPRPARL